MVGFGTLGMSTFGNRGGGPATDIFDVFILGDLKEPLEVGEETCSSVVDLDDLRLLLEKMPMMGEALEGSPNTHHLSLLKGTPTAVAIRNF